VNFLKKFLLLILGLLVGAGLILVTVRLNGAGQTDLATLMTILTTTALTLGTLLAIITAGLMFTQGKFSELVSELNNKSPDYLATLFPLEKVQNIGNYLMMLREEFKNQATVTTVAEERNLYERIVEKTSSMFADFAVLLNLKMKQQGLPPTDLFVAEMDSSLYAMYQEKRQNIKKDWQLLILVKHIRDVLEGPLMSFAEKSDGRTALDNDLRKSIAILKLKETVDKSSTNLADKIMETRDGLSDEIGQISKRLHEDRIPQLLSQMNQLHAVRGKYFHLTVIFIAVPLLIDLIILPQLSQTTAAFFQPIIFMACALSVLGVAFLLLYVYKILNV
jgi:hypothetical protein